MLRAKKKMNYWVVRGSPAENGNFHFIKAGVHHTWRTKRPPRSWEIGDRLLFWASSPRKEMIALGQFEGETDERTEENEVIYKLKYLTKVLERPLIQSELRADPLLKDATFLKVGPARSVLRLSESEGSRLYQLLIFRNPALTGIWPDLEVDVDSVPDVDESGLEGERRLAQHFRIERSRSLVEAKKKWALATTGRLACEVCGFDFEARYGLLGAGLCEVHHLQPLSLISTVAMTTLRDLAILCSNCHRIAHRSACALSLDEIRMSLR